MRTSKKEGKAKLGDLIEMQKGFAFKSYWYCDSGQPIVKVSNFTNDSIDTSNLVKIPFDIAKKFKKYELKEGDVVIQTVGSWPSNPASVVGKCIRVPREANNTLLNQNAVRLKPEGDLDNDFLYYILRAPEYSNYIVGTAQGAASQAAVTLDAIRAYKFYCLDYNCQRKIATLLSSYDDLIENNLRRIKILEEMAQNLYREWFVHFRFPGHEKIHFVDSPLGRIPEGWEMKRLDEIIAGHIGGGWGRDEPKGKYSEPAWVIRGTDIPNAKHCNVSKIPFRYHTESNLKTRKLKPGDIIFEVSGGSKDQPLGRALLISSEIFRLFYGYPVICASFCKRVQPSYELYAPEMLYLSFLEGYGSGEIEQFQVQSTGISNFRWSDYLEKVYRCVPPRSIQDSFREITVPIFSQISMLGLKNHFLRQTRDLLLPKLISGEVDVSELDIKVPEEVAI